MGVKRVRLEHHRNAALRWWHIIDNLTVNLQFAAGNFLQPRNHAQKRRLATARRADKNNQLAGLDIQIDILENIHRAAICFRDIG